jgi:hypothetical protein
LGGIILQQDIYIDGISNIHLTGHIVRFDLVSLQPQLRSEDGQPVFQTTGRIVMPAEAFLQAFQLQEAAIKQMIQAGILKEQTVLPNATVAPAGDKSAADE